MIIIIIIIIIIIMILIFIFSSSSSPEALRAQPLCSVALLFGPARTARIPRPRRRPATFNAARGARRWSVRNRRWRRVLRHCTWALDKNGHEIHEMRVVNVAVHIFVWLPKEWSGKFDAVFWIRHIFLDENHPWDGHLESMNSIHSECEQPGFGHSACSISCHG